jgi:hypothetical protein
MQYLDTSKLKSAMIDAAILRAERTMRDDDALVMVHPEYRAKWEYTLRELRFREHRQKRNTRILAFIIAAAIMALAGCAWTYREKIADFWVTAFDKYDKLEIDDIGEDFPRTIEEVYIPTYVPEGYELEYEQIDLFKVQMKWKNNGDYIMYTQTLKPKSRAVLDSEVGEYIIKQWDDYTIFCYSSVDRRSYIWLGRYRFCLFSSKGISDKEFEKIIENIFVYEEKYTKKESR